MTINAIVCVNKNWGIGKDRKLLYHIPEDMERFKENTSGSIVVYGRKTMETFPDGKPLKNRKNIVLTKHLDNISSEIKNSVNYYGAIKKMKNKDAMFNVVGLKNFKFNKFPTVLLSVDSIDMLIHTLNIIADKNSEVWIIGGESIYRQMLPYCSQILVTEVDDDKEADSYFPDLTKEDDWKLYFSGPTRCTPNGLKYKFSTYMNKKLDIGEYDE